MIMKKIFSIFVLLTLLTMGCKKDEPTPFVPGDLAIGITSNANLKTVFDTLNVLNFKIETMHGFFYNANFHKDSLKPLLDYLNTKQYINIGTGWTASAYYYEPEKTIRVLCSLFDMTPSNQIDFMITVDSLGLVDRHSETKCILIKIPVGTEEYWLTELKKYPFIKWTELNHIGQISIDV